MAEKKRLVSALEQRNGIINETMDYAGTADVGEKQYEKDKKKKKKSAISEFMNSVFAKK